MRENIWKNIKLGFKTNKLAVVGAAAIILLALISIFAFLYPVDPNAISATERLNAPSMAHLFGTDDMGRDYLARCIYGSSMDFTTMDIQTLAERIPDFAPYLHQCKFNDCIHVQEPNCAIREAVEKQEINGERYAHYLEVVQMIKQAKPKY